MRRKGSDIAKEIIASWKREENGKKKLKEIGCIGLIRKMKK